VNGRRCRKPEEWVDLEHDRIEVDSSAVEAAQKIYLMLNKPRGLVTSTSDEQGRATVFECLAGAEIPPVVPVGRLDKASEGLLLFTNDTHWAARVTAPEIAIEKTYHVQVDQIADARLLELMQKGLESEGDFLRANQARLLRQGSRNSWLEIILTEGKNRHIRRLLAALNVGVLRLVRVAVGPLELGNLAKGAFRHLTTHEVGVLGGSKNR
jgi:23S rRNA pseudouridine2605 synthase